MGAGTGSPVREDNGRSGAQQALPGVGALKNRPAPPIKRAGNPSFAPSLPEDAPMPWPLPLRSLALAAALLALPAAAHASGAAAQKKAGKRPNILYIMSDDHANAAIGAYGSWLKDVVKTPNIDKLARQGMRFKQCAVTNSICTPSRAAILTGQYSHKNGVYTLQAPIAPNRRHLGHLLQGAGYATAVVGKWHLHTAPTGFDYWKILPGQGKYTNPFMLTKDGKKEETGYSEDVIA